MTRAAALLALTLSVGLAGCALLRPPAAGDGTTPGAMPPAREAPAVCVPEGESCAGAQARCCAGLICASARQPTCIPRY